MRSLDTGDDLANGSDTEDADDDSDLEDPTWRRSQRQPQNSKVIPPITPPHTLTMTFLLYILPPLTRPLTHPLAFVPCTLSHTSFTRFLTKAQQPGGISSGSGAINNNGTTKPPVPTPSLPGDVLYDTLYRYIVLFANMPSDNDSVDHTNHGHSHNHGHRDSSFHGTSDTMNSWFEGNVVWNVVLESIGLITVTDKRKNRRTKLSERNRVLRDTCIRQFTSDHGTWGMHTGVTPPLHYDLPPPRYDYPHFIMVTPT